MTEQKREKEQLRSKDREDKENEVSRRFQMMDHLTRINSLERQSQQEEKSMYKK